MKDSIRVVGISGSLRKQSYNKKLLDLAAAELPKDVDYVFASFGELPILNPDIRDSIPEVVTQFQNLVESADAVLFSTPIYNNSIPGGMKNAIDWLTRPAGKNYLSGKVAGIMGATPGMSGTINAQAHLREMLTFLNMIVVPQPMVFVAGVHNKIDENGNLKLDPAGQEFLQKHVERFMELTNLLVKG